MSATKPCNRHLQIIMLLLAVSLAPVYAAAHEFWVEPEKHLLAVGDTIVANLKVGQNLEGSVFPYLSNRFLSFRIIEPGGASPLPGNEGDIPAINYVAKQPGLNLIAYHSTADRVQFDDWGAYLEYLEYEGLDWVPEAHRARGLFLARVDEVYTRCAKALVQVGGNRDGGQDRLTGMPLEIVAGANPYADATLTELPVTVFWQNEPLAGIQIRTFQMRDQLATRTVRTDADGRAIISLEGGGRFLLNAVHVRQAPAALNAHWESFWASLTFDIQVGR